MSALLTVEDLEDAMGGVDFTEAQTAVASYLIGRVSSYLESATNCSFSPITDYTARKKANDYGEISLQDFYPVTDISNFHDFCTDLDISYPRWDGIETLRNLFPNQVIDVTFDYGFATVPADIKGVATEACRRGMATNATNLVMKTVGDVIYEYGDMFTFNAADQQVIDSYSSDSQRTLMLGIHRGDPYNSNTLLQQMLPWANGPDCPPEWGMNWW